MSAEDLSQETPSRTAGEAGWHVSRYNVMAQVPGTKKVAIANLYKGNCAEYTPIEMYLLSVVEELDENHPAIERFARKMSASVQDDVVALAGRMLDASRTKDIHVTWFGGEPLLAPDVIESLSGRLMALAEERGGRYEASIVTNGYLLTQDIADMLGRLKVNYSVPCQLPRRHLLTARQIRNRPSQRVRPLGSCSREEPKCRTGS